MSKTLDFNTIFQEKPNKNVISIFIFTVAKKLKSTFVQFFSEQLSSNNSNVIIPKNIPGFKYAESMAIYMETNRNVERMSKIGYYILVRVSVPCFVLPKAIYSFYQYFTTDFGNEGFELSLPMW